MQFAPTEPDLKDFVPLGDWSNFCESSKRISLAASLLYNFTNTKDSTVAARPPAVVAMKLAVLGTALYKRGIRM